MARKCAILVQQTRGGVETERGMLRKRLRQEEQPQRLLPMSILERHIFPHAFERLSEALDVLMVCKDAFALLETREFWAPFLNRVMKSRMLWMRKRGFLALATTMERVYQLFPTSMNVLDAVKSKFFFDECPEDFPYAYEVPVHQQRFWAISKSKFRASGFLEDERRGVPGYRCAQYREASPSWSYRGTYLQRLCSYTASGVLFSTYNCREYLAAYPSLVTVAGWKSSFSARWYRLGLWTISGPEQTTEEGARTPAFQFQGHFSLAIEKPKFLASVGEGRLEVDGEDLGVFRAFNLSETPVPDWEANTLGLEGVANPQQCFILNFRTGMLERKHPEFRLLVKARQLREWLAAEAVKKEKEENEEEEEEAAAAAVAAAAASPAAASVVISPRSASPHRPVVPALFDPQRKRSGRPPKNSKKRLAPPPKRKTPRKGSNDSLIISEYDYSNLGRAAYVCRRPEGVFTADDLADRFDDYGVDQVMSFDQRHRIPAEIAVIVGRRKTSKGEDEYRVRWQGYGEYYDTWEPERNLGVHASDAREQFGHTSVATDDEDDES